MLSNLIFWAVVGVVSFSESVFFYTVREKEIPWVTILIWDINWLMWLFASLPIVHLVRYVKSRTTWNQFIWWMALLCILLSFGLVFIEAVLNYSAKMARSEESVFSEIFVLILTYKVHVNVIIVCTLTGMTVAFDAYKQAKIHEIRTKELEAREEELMRQLAEAQLQTLKRQLRPHFLFNSLHLISGLVLKKENENAMEMITRLSDLLRQTLKYDQQSWISLKEEIRLTKLYLEIHQVRFGPGLETQINANPDALKIQIPTFLIQPIVENSLVHGIEPNKNTGLIIIDCLVEKGFLKLTVEDNGAGTKNLSSINEGIGISNTRSRLQTLFEDNYSFEFGDLPDGGFYTKISIPILSTEHSNDVT